MISWTMGKGTSVMRGVGDRARSEGAWSGWGLRSGRIGEFEGPAITSSGSSGSSEDNS